MPLLFALLTCLLHALPALAAAPLAVRIDATRRHQTIEGWGTGMLGHDLANMPFRDERFREAYRDLGLNIFRVCMSRHVLIAPDGNHATPEALGDNLDANIAKMDFAHPEVANYGDMARWLTEHALEPERVKIVGSVWSPPHWMKGPTGKESAWIGDWKKTAGKHPTPWLTGDYADWQAEGTGDSVGGRLRTENPQILGQYGRYMAAWVRGFERHFGVTMHAISIQNESTFENPFDSMTLYLDARGRRDPTQYALALGAVRDAWVRYGLSTKIKGPHVAQIGPTPQNPWSLAAQTSMIDAARDAGLGGFLDYYNSNYYMETSPDAVRATAGYYRGTAAVDAEWGREWGTPFTWRGVKRDGKPVWLSEAGGEEREWLAGADGTPGNGALTIPLKMHNALVFANAVSYLYWQLSDNEAEASSHALLGKDALGEPLRSRKYAGFKHFSRHVRPGAQRVEAIIDDPARRSDTSSYGGGSEFDTRSALNVSAYVHDDDRSATIVFVNMRHEACEVSIAVPMHEVIRRYKVSVTDRERSWASLADLDVVDGKVSLTIPRYSAVTLYGGGE